MTPPSRDVPALPSDRAFGALFVAVFALLGAWSWWTAGATWPYWAGLAAATLAVALLRPRSLRPLNRLWMRFAEILHRVISPVMLGIVFFAVVTPFGVVMRLAGRDPLARRFDRRAGSYWIERRPPGPDPRSIANQF